MVLGEIRDGRVSRTHHSRLLTFAAQLGISHAAATELIADCCTESASSTNPDTRRHAERLASPRDPRMLRSWLIIAIIVAAELAMILVL
jgi:hypothetical protein